MHKPQIINETVGNMKCKQRIIILPSVSLRLQEDHKKKGRNFPFLPEIQGEGKEEGYATRIISLSHTVLL